MSETVENVACTVCGCVCDDLRITVDGGRVLHAENACSLSEPWLLKQTSEFFSPAEIDGRPVTFDEGLARAAEILGAARAPLIYGLSRSSTDGQRAAIALADQLGATIDTTASRCHAPSILAFHQVGESTCSLGEVRNRCDLVIYWGSNPVESHPRHLERYSLYPAGRFVSGRAERTLVVADIRETASSALADVFVPVAPDGDFSALWTLRSLIRGWIPPAGVDTGAPRDVLEDLARRMKSCRSGVVFFGLGLTRGRLGHRNVEALLALVRDLNDYTRFYARRMRVQGDVAGADSVLCWQTGYPFSVNFARGYPRYNPGEFSANDLLERNEVDACVLVGSEGVEWFSPAAKARLREIPTIVLDYPGTPTAFVPQVRFTTAVYGVHRAGTAYRMDEVPIPLRPFLSLDGPSDAEVLASLATACHFPASDQPITIGPERERQHSPRT